MKDQLKPLDAVKLERLLKFVTEGEQDKAEAIIQRNPKLLLAWGTVKDLSDRTFKSITAFQYALWAMDYHMWTMITQYLPPKAQVEQFNALETIGTEHGNHYDIKPLTQALQTYVDQFDSWSLTEKENHLYKKVGAAQRRVPAHVANEYARTDRAFVPCPEEWKSELPRWLVVPSMWYGDRYHGSSWFVPLCYLTEKASNFAFLRSNLKGGVRCVQRHDRVHKADVSADLTALLSLWEARTQQLNSLSYQLQQRTQQRTEIVNVLQFRLFKEGIDLVCDYCDELQHESDEGLFPR